VVASRAAWTSGWRRPRSCCRACCSSPITATGTWAVCQWVFSQDRPTDAGDGEVYDPSSRCSTRTTAPCRAGRAMSTRASSRCGRWRTAPARRSTPPPRPWCGRGPTLGSPGSPRPCPTGEGRRPKPGKDGDGQIDLGWLLDQRRQNTVYLCSPIEDQRRLAPAFGGLLNDLINQAYRHVAETGKPSTRRCWW
jgi:hypothetical protein